MNPTIKKNKLCNLTPKNNTRLFITCFVWCFTIVAYSQDLTQLGKAKLFALSGGVSANSIFYDGSATREPFTYVLSGNLNLNISNIYNIPFSFSYSNQEFQTNNPFYFNRLSIHPSYKWITAHIGDVAMSFSPYTLNGHQFTGLGVDITPKEPFKVSAMYGRLLKPVEYNMETPEILPVYKRFGYGLKAEYNLDKAKLGVSFFSARDQINSLDQEIPLDIGVDPKENLVVSLQASVKPLKGMVVNAEYASSAVTENLNTEEYNGSLGPLSFIFNERLSTSYYDAFNVQVNYAVGNGSVGAGYERIDPDYRTFGAYYFNNDLQNITFNASQKILKNRLGINFNIGVQQDNLDDTKTSELKRIVTAVNVNYEASERLNIAGSYSNFQSFTNIRNQFDFINEVTQFDNLDTLNFKQLSQNANLTIGYVVSKDKRKQQNLNLNLAFQDTRDLQEQILTGEENTVNNSRLYNGGASYTISFAESDLRLSGVFNATLNEVQQGDNVILGPTVVVGKSFFDKKLRTTFSGSYNTSYTDGTKQNDVFNFRVNAGYELLKKHRFNLSLLTLFRNTVATNTHDFTGTLGYNYAFATGEKKKSKQEKIKQQDTDDISSLRYRYRDEVFDGGFRSMINKLENIRNRELSDLTIPKLDSLKSTIMAFRSGKNKALKALLIDYTDQLYQYIDFNKGYNETLYKAVMALRSDVNKTDREVEARFVNVLTNIENHKFKGVNPKKIENGSDAEVLAYKELYEGFTKKKEQFIAHRWMQEKLNQLTGRTSFNKNTDIKTFRIRYFEKSYALHAEKQEDAILKNYLTKELIMFYQELAKSTANPETYNLRYTQKN